MKTVRPLKSHRGYNGMSSVTFAFTALVVLAGCSLGAAGVRVGPIATPNSTLNNRHQSVDRGGPAAGSARQPGSQAERSESIPSGGDYVLEPTDVIEVHIEDAPELSKKLPPATYNPRF